MKIEKLGKKYAQFLLETASGQGATESVVNDFLSLQMALEGDKGLQDFVLSPLVSSALKLEILKKINFTPMSFRCLEILAERRRWPLLMILGNCLEAESKKMAGIAKGKVTSGQNLDESEKESIRRSLEALTRKRLELVFSVDPGVIAGFVAEVEGLKVEETISNHLKNMSENLIRSVH